MQISHLLIHHPIPIQKQSPFLHISAMTFRNESCQSIILHPNRSLSLLQSIREFAGRFAGVGYSAVVIASISANRTPGSALAPQLAPPPPQTRTTSSPPHQPRDRPRPHQPAHSTSLPTSQPPLALPITSAVIPARSRLHVGAPCWSATTRNVSRSRASFNIVSRKFFPSRPVHPARPEDHMRRPALRQRLSPASLLAPYTLTGPVASVSVIGRIPTPSKT